MNVKKQLTQDNTKNDNRLNINRVSLWTMNDELIRKHENELNNDLSIMQKSIQTQLDEEREDSNLKNLNEESGNYICPTEIQLFNKSNNDISKENK